MKRLPLHASLRLVGAAVFAFCAHAQGAGGAEVFDTPPPPAAPRPLRIATPAEATLPNGLRVIVAERHDLPLVSTELLVLQGAEADPPQRAGRASMAAGLLTRGTRRHSAPQLAVAAERLGGSLDSSAGWNESSVSITVTTPKLSDALSLVAEVAMQPTFAPAEIDRLRSQTLDELKVTYADPGELAALVSQRAVYGAGGYGHPLGGTPASLPRMTRTDLLAQHAGAFRPDNAVLVFAGDIDMPAALAMARRHFGAWKAPKAALAAPVAGVDSPWPNTSTVVVDVPSAGQAGVAIALSAMPADAPDRYAGSVANVVLGGAYSSRLNEEIRVKRGLSYGARSQLALHKAGGALRISVQTKNPSAAEVVALIDGELDGLMKGLVPDAELSARKASQIGSFSSRLETTQGLASQVAALAVNGLPMSDLPQRIERIGAIGPADVQAFAVKYFGADHRHVVIAGVAADFSTALKSMTPVIVTLPQSALDLDASAVPVQR